MKKLIICLLILSSTLQASPTCSRVLQDCKSAVDAQQKLNADLTAENKLLKEQVKTLTNERNEAITEDKANSKTSILPIIIFSLVGVIAGGILFHAGIL